MKIANIIYDGELVNHTKSEYVNYYNNSENYDSLDKTLPTLYVGWSFMKSCNPDNSIIQNADILHKKIIANELYWECSFAESKSSHVKGVDNFVKLAPQFYFQPKYTYINLDPVFFQIVDVQGLMDAIPKEIITMYNFKNEMLYILCENKITHAKNISGINLKMYEFFKFDTKEIIERIIERSETSYDDPQGMFYQEQYKIFPNFPLLKRYLIVILSN
jgi:hypothetical protein